jgi:carboxyl-terminal processing protease
VTSTKKHRHELVRKSKDWFTGKKITVYLILLIIIVGVFVVGVDVGSGRIDIHFGDSHNSQLPDQLNFSSVNQVYQILKSQYDGKLTTAQLLDGLKTGLANSLNDPYTEYFNAAQAKAFNSELQGSFSGIGAELGENSSSEIEVIAPLAGTPAAKAGLQPQDIIVSVNGVSTASMSIDSAVNDIRGPQGTKVTLQIVRGQTPMTFKITRETITVPSVNSKILSGNIGYMQITQFTDDTSSLAQQAAQKFKQAGVKGIILDLRDNPGGEVDAAVNVSSLWLDAGQTIMVEKTGSVVVQTYISTGNDLLKGIPTVVLVNDGSASASEITASALHDNHDAYIIGTQTYGKGVVQQINNLNNGGELKVTIAHWYRPDGKSINHIGITPDKVVTITEAQVQAGQDPQEAAALTYLQSL